jgi:hypothetical protein
MESVEEILMPRVGVYNGGAAPAPGVGNTTQRLMIVRVCALCIALTMVLGFPAQAWEFKMRTEFEYRLRYFSRIGDKDLFGQASVQEGGISAAGIGFAGPIWYSLSRDRAVAAANANVAAPRLIVRGGFARYDCDAQIADMRMTFYPSIIVNRALSWYMTITAGGFRHKFAMTGMTGDSMDVVTNVGYSVGTIPLPAPFDFIDQWIVAPTSTLTTLNYEVAAGIPPFERYYMSQTSDSAFSTASIFSIEQMKAVINTPIGYISLGTKDFPIGIGATFARNSREESIYLAVPNGPLTFSLLVFPGEPPRHGELYRVATGYNTIPDGGLKSHHFIGLVTQYHSGTGEIGLGAFHQTAHLSKGYVTPRANTDHDFFQGLVWAKFNNGRLFCNGELSWTEANIRRSYRDDPVVVPKVSLEGYHWITEFGFILGPVKSSLMLARASGPVLTGNAGVTRFPYPNPTKIYIPLNINYQALEPYEYLMFRGYGGGNSFAGRPHTTLMNPDGSGEMGDAYAYAGRVDLSVAANLNVWASYIWAHRLEVNGFYAGQAGSFITDNPTYYGSGDFTAAAAQLWKSRNGYGPIANPFPDDGFIGWEAGVGVDWGLLDGLTFRMRYAYWQPGAWFDQAYKAYTATPWGVLGEGLMVGRSPIHAFETTILMEL